MSLSAGTGGAAAPRRFLAGSAFTQVGLGA
jgi:hypothetical protein